MLEKLPGRFIIAKINPQMLMKKAFRLLLAAASLAGSLGSAAVFTVTNAGTGLNCWMIAHQTDTPVVNVFLVKVG